MFQILKKVKFLKFYWKSYVSKFRLFIYESWIMTITGFSFLGKMSSSQLGAFVCKIRINTAYMVQTEPHYRMV